jgi:hypothetical protein
MVVERTLERINLSFPALIHDSQKRPLSRVRFALFALIAGVHCGAQMVCTAWENQLWPINIARHPSQSIAVENEDQGQP